MPSQRGWVKKSLQEGDDLFSTGMMVVILKHVGTTAWLRDMLNMSVKTSVSSPAQSLSTRPGILSDPKAFLAFTAATPGCQERVGSSVLGCCWVPQSKQWRHSVHTGNRATNPGICRRLPHHLTHSPSCPQVHLIFSSEDILGLQESVDLSSVSCAIWLDQTVSVSVTSSIHWQSLCTSEGLWCCCSHRRFKMFQSVKPCKESKSDDYKLKGDLTYN